ncbi:CBASS cGAMP synthase [Sphaerotilus sp.]|uniref:CBASS cGAMP synthase n=1 Tax=Sphaerotilus sp. TaxID=2093942 RepID=UPI002ACE061A|nr:CBASS cGAMP synthase [Sphaerotilus sp.]MDZ7854773.1 CBASS cGAMP synthase [Sphaerotilus sp.]
MLKFPKLFFQSNPDADAFESHIRPSAEQRRYLRSCVTKISDHLKPRITQVTKTVLGMDRSVIPRFRTQGSWSYDTCVVPAMTPPQEMDWDYGIYLPVTVWKANGPPHEMAKAYFDLVEKLLQDLCDKEKWALLPGKDTCIRIQVASWAHVDVPLYAAPEDEFEKITESVAVLKAHTYDSLGMESIDFAEGMQTRQQWADLKSVVMATRKGEWKPSDPQVVANWFRDRVEEHGPQLRRVCRYLKAWRDHHWGQGGPTSVSIMIAVAQAFEPRDGRDDRAIEDSAKRMSRTFLGEIREPGIDDGKEDFNRLQDADRRATALRFGELAAQILQARESALHERELVVDRLHRQFGERLPKDCMRVEIDSDPDAIRKTPASRVAVPVIPSTKAG